MKYRILQFSAIWIVYLINVSAVHSESIDACANSNLKPKPMNIWVHRYKSLELKNEFDFRSLSFPASAMPGYDYPCKEFFHYAWKDDMLGFRNALNIRHPTRQGTNQRPPPIPLGNVYSEFLFMCTHPNLEKFYRQSEVDDLLEGERRCLMQQVSAVKKDIEAEMKITVDQLKEEISQLKSMLEE